MDILLRVWAVVLFLAGVPAFLGLAAVFVGVSIAGPPTDADAVPKFVLLYLAFAVSGLVSAAGCLLWAVARLAYPPRSREAT